MPDRFPEKPGQERDCGIEGSGDSRLYRLGNVEYSVLGTDGSIDMTVSVVLVEEHATVRKGVKSLLESLNGYTVVGETSDGMDAIRLITELQPELLVTELAVKKLSGIELARQTKRISPNTKIIVFSQDNNEERILEALRAGAKGYILKEDSLDEITRAVEQVMSGHCYLSPSILSLAIQALLQKKPPGVRDSYETLTTREREVFQLTAQGFSNTEIAEKLFISKRTVDVHRTNLLRKLGLKTKRNQLHEYAIQAGILPRESRN